MKIKLTILLAALLLGGAVLGSAQTQGDKDKKAPTDPNAPAEATPKDEDIADFTYDDIDLFDLIKSLALRAGLNPLFDPKLISAVNADGTPVPRPKVPAFSMKQITAQQVLEAILNNNSLQMVPDPKTKTVRISTKDPLAQEPLVTRVVQLKFSSTTNIVTMLTGILSSRAKISSEPRNAQLIISATDKEWDLITNLMEKVDTITKQVLIEARILETSKNPKSLKGIDWTSTLQGQNFAFGNGVASAATSTTIPGTPVTTTTILPNGLPLTTTTSPASTSTATITGTAGNGNAGFSLNTFNGLNPAYGFLTADGVRGVLSFLNADNDTEVLATPRTVMVDNQTARLSVTRAFPIFKVTPGTVQVPASSEIQYTNLGTILEVTPRISANSNISLRVVPEVSNIDGQDSQTVNGQKNTANIYAIRRIETQVIIPSGNTLVMGGLISDTTVKTQSKVPILGDIPFIGNFFHHEAKTQNKGNLMIFLTPTIIEQNHFQPPASDFLGSGYQTPADQFLKTRPVDKAEKPTSAWDSATPKDWGKKGNKK